MAEQRKVRRATAPDATGDTDAGGQAAPQRPRQDGRKDRMAKVEDRLNEMFAHLAMAQGGIGLLSQDPRHLAGANVTENLGPSLSAAWCKLGRENTSVAAALIRITEGGAWGEVVLASLGFVYSQAQAYQLVPPIMPNPWTQEPIVPPSPEGMDAMRNGGMGVTPEDGAATTAGVGTRPPPRSGVDDDQDPAHVIAERERRAAEQARLRQRQGGQ